MTPPRSFAAAYEGTPPWELGRPQRALVQAAELGRLTGKVIDLGCGTGEHALLAASRGLEAVGIDAVGRAIDLARKKAVARGLSARFLVHDALVVDRLGEPFDTGIDCGLFHTFTDEERALYVRALSATLKPGGTLLLLCFSDEETSERGPRRITRAELTRVFEPGFELVSLEPSRFETTEHEGGAKAWFASYRRR